MFFLRFPRFLPLALGLAFAACHRDLALPDSADGGSDGSATPTFAVTQHHNRASRDGVYTAAGLTRAAAAGLHRDASFRGAVDGPIYAQPLAYTTSGGRRIVIVATEQASVVALDAATGTRVWQHDIGSPVPLSSLPCGNIDPLGITGTPVIDSSSATIYVASMATPDGGTTKRHLVFAFSLEDGSLRSGWPIDVAKAVPSFDAAVQNQRGALLVQGGVLYVPFGGHYGDCGDYRGWLVGIPLADPQHPKAWSTSARGGGAWSPPGVAGDGSAVFIVTGNTVGATTWSGGEALLRFDPGPVLSAEYHPADWMALDASDEDIGSAGPVLMTRPGATPLALVLGKNGKAYLIETSHMTLIASALVTTDEIIGAPALFSGPQGGRAYFHGSAGMCPKGESGDLTAIPLTPGSQPILTPLWCAQQNGAGSPIVTTTDGQAEAIVWSIGAGGDERLRGFDAETGAVIFDGGGAAEQLHRVRGFQTPIVAGDRIYVASDDEIAAFAW